MSGQKIGSTAGRGLAAARGVPAVASHQESTVHNDANRETAKTPELKETTSNKIAGQEDQSLKTVNQSKSVDGKSASGGGGGNGDPGNGATPTDNVQPWYKRRGFIGAAVGTALGATAAVVAAPLVIGAMGFGAGGIAAGSYAAGMMSSAAIANGGAVAAGSLVATLQSIGAAGFGLAGLAGVGAAGAGVGATVGGGAGAVADLIAGNGNAAAEETQEARDQGEEGKENSDDVAEAMANLNVEEAEGQPTEELLSIIVSESDGSVRTFAMRSSDPLQRMFDEYFHATGLSPESVRFEFNGLRLDGSVSPGDLGIESDNVVKALRI